MQTGTQKAFVPSLARFIPRRTVWLAIQTAKSCQTLSARSRFRSNSAVKYIVNTLRKLRSWANILKSRARKPRLSPWLTITKTYFSNKTKIVAKSDVDFAQSVLENAHICIVFPGHLSFLPACAAILDFKNGHGSSLGFSIGVGDLCLLYLWFWHAYKHWSPSSK